MNSQENIIVEGWYSDPIDNSKDRYWNGNSWTSAIREKPQTMPGQEGFPLPDAVPDLSEQNLPLSREVSFSEQDLSTAPPPSGPQLKGPDMDSQFDIIDTTVSDALPSKAPPLYLENESSLVDLIEQRLDAWDDILLWKRILIIVFAVILTIIILQEIALLVFSFLMIMYLAVRWKSSHFLTRLIMIFLTVIFIGSFLDTPTSQHSKASGSGKQMQSAAPGKKTK